MVSWITNNFVNEMGILIDYDGKWTTKSSENVIVS